MVGPNIPSKESPSQESPRELPKVPEAPVETPATEETTQPKEGEPREGEQSLLEFEIEEPPSLESKSETHGGNSKAEISPGDVKSPINTVGQAGELQDLLNNNQ